MQKPISHETEGDLEKKIHQVWRQIQRSLFPDDDLGPLTAKHGHVVVVLDHLDLARFVTPPSAMGRPPRDRAALASAFVAKAVLGLVSTEALMERLACDKVLRHLCGFEPYMRLPSAATFSNAFAEFSQSELPSKIHEAVIKQAYIERLVGHVCRDATDISARGKVPKVAKTEKGKRKNRVKGKRRRVVRQQTMNLSEMLEDLPRHFDASTKRGHSWKGYKLHIDVADDGVPLSAIVTSASLHDSQAAIPLEELTSRRVNSLYSLMDAAYDAKEIREFIRGKNKVPLIEPHNRPGQTIVLDPAERRRYGERTTVERAFSRLKEHFGARHVLVRGSAKVTAHLMFGILALTAEQLVRHAT